MVMVLCGICKDKKYRSDMFKKSSCTHPYCQSCIAEYVNAKIRDRVVKVKCPDPGCDALLYPNGCRDFVPLRVRQIWEAELREALNGTNAIDQCPGNIAGEDLDKKFEELAAKEKWQKCGNCKFYVERIAGCESIRCRCGYNFCYICGGNWIYGHVCPPGTRS